MTTLGIITLFFLFAESGGQVVKRTSNRVKWFLSIIIVTTLIIITVVLLLAESGDQEAGNSKALGDFVNIFVSVTGISVLELNF